jgi:cryptochrome
MRLVSTLFSFVQFSPLKTHFHTGNTRTSRRFWAHRIRMSSLSVSSGTGASEDKYKVAIHWFRNGLRFHDNPCLLDACHMSETLLPVYVIDPEAPFAQTAGRRAGTIRANFLMESLKEVNAKLRGMGSRLVVIVGKPSEVLPEIAASVQASALFYEQENAAPIREVDAEVLEAITKRMKQGGDIPGFEIKRYPTHTLHPIEHYLTNCKGMVAPSTYGGFTKIFQSMTVPFEVDTVTEVPPFPEKALDNLQKLLGDDLQLPTLQRLGYDNTDDDLKNRGRGGFDFVGGEAAALDLLDETMKRTQWVATFEKPKTSPNDIQRPSTTALSPCK